MVVVETRLALLRVQWVPHEPEEHVAQVLAEADTWEASAESAYVEAAVLLGFVL